MAYWIVEDHGFCGQHYRCSNCRNVWIDTYEDIPENACPKCGRPINQNKTKYIDKPKKHKTETNTDNRCVRIFDLKQRVQYHPEVGTYVSEEDIDLMERVFCKE